MRSLLVVGIGGFLGAISRWGIAGLGQRIAGESFPLGTLVANVAGCVLIGGLMTLVEDRQLLSPEARMLVLTGFLGSLTTFSTFGWESTALLRDDGLGLALLNVGANLVLGLGGVWVGAVCARLL